MDKVEEIKTMSLRDYISNEMSKLDSEAKTIFQTNSIAPDICELLRLKSLLARLDTLQEIAYRVEYGFIEEIGNTDLKEWLVRP